MWVAVATVVVTSTSADEPLTHCVTDITKSGWMCPACLGQHDAEAVACVKSRAGGQSGLANGWSNNHWSGATESDAPQTHVACKTQPSQKNLSLE
jgi:hypothetical protein